MTADNCQSIFLATPQLPHSKNPCFFGTLGRNAEGLTTFLHSGKGAGITFRTAGNRDRSHPCARHDGPHTELHLCEEPASSVPVAQIRDQHAAVQRHPHKPRQPSVVRSIYNQGFAQPVPTSSGWGNAGGLLRTTSICAGCGCHRRTGLGSVADPLSPGEGRQRRAAFCNSPHTENSTRNATCRDGLASLPPAGRVTRRGSRDWGVCRVNDVCDGCAYQRTVPLEFDNPT
ncbi:hypothetical protein LMG19083_05021 [Ralstonia psammae]|uniref:Uncharacterized protein n=1 Tax=Ralstonia psammae TaxID=3058598 RepID=A0ABM9K0Y5_9RALS|nr:hypothetical protein LMG19083_05021 [Ralstonia sp. LMG 19083]